MINKELRDYLDNTILPRYSTYDKGHNIDHITEVANASLELAQGKNLDLDMIYTAAIFHDLGLIEGRETHHLTSAVMLRKDEFINDFFDSERINIIAMAIEDHRASCKNPPRTIYSEILSSADRIIEPNKIIMRTYYYGLDHYPEIDFEEQLVRIYEHIQNKYSENGYLKIPILTSKNKLGLSRLRELSSDKISFIAYCKELINR